MQALRTASSRLMPRHVINYHAQSSMAVSHQLRLDVYRQLSTASAMHEVSAADKEEKKAAAAPAKKRAPRARKAVLEVSDRAAQRVAELMAQKDPPPVGIRLGVRTRGCNGLSYTMNYLDEAPKLDDVVEAQGVKVFIDPKAVMFLLGSRMDFVEDAVRAEFTFENPNAKGSCGCGESFNV